MTKTTSGFGNQTSKNFHADTPFLVKPTVMDGRKVDGVKMYVGIGKYRGKKYIKELFDRMFKSAI